MTLKGRLVLTLPLFLVVVFGCEKGNPHAPATVSGKVTYQGKPVTAGSVTFQPKKEGPVYVCNLSADGTYNITEVAAGDFTVTVETESANLGRKTEQYAAPGAGGEGGGSSPPPPGVTTAPPSTGEYRKIPEKYSDPKTSTLTATLGAGKQVKDFPLAD